MLRCEVKNVNALFLDAYTLYGSFGSEVSVTLKVTLDLRAGFVTMDDRNATGLLCAENALKTRT